MEPVQQSLYRVYSIGIVAENKSIGKHQAMVTPIEVMAMMDGELSTNEETLDAEGIDGLDGKYSVSVNMNTAIPAQWLPIGSNRITPPDVRRGERVLIWQFADEDKFWWTSMGLDDNLRRLETVVFAVSNESDKDKNIETLTPENSYYIEFNTHTKHITLATNKNDNEPFAYTFQFNTKEGFVTLADDDENFFEFNSRDTIFTFKNKYDTIMQADQETINLFSVKDINLRTETLNVEATTINYTATDINTTATNITEESTTKDVTATTMNITAETTHTGNFTLAGALAMTGPLTLTGDSAIAGNVAITGALLVNGVDVGPLHQHAVGGPVVP